MILARHGEALFWAGRYLERAEGSARMLDVTTRAAMHVDPSDATATWLVLLESLRLTADHAAAGSSIDEQGVATFLLAGGATPGSIQHSVNSLRENLRTARERVPIELWEEASRLYLALGSSNVPAMLEGQPRELYAQVRRGCQAVSGVISEAMTRDEGYAFLVMGRMIERSLFTTQLLESTLSAPSEVFDPDRVLRSTSAMQAFHRLHGHGATQKQVMLFLLQAPEVPRSVLSCSDLLHRSLLSIGDADNIARPQQLVGRLRSRLEFHQVEEEVLVEPFDALRRVHAELGTIAASISAHLFHSAVLPLPTSQFVRPGFDAR